MNGCAFNELSKEEIKKAKDDFRFFNEGDYITKEMTNSKEKIFEYIEQLELYKQKLIDKLEEDIKVNQENYKINTDGFEEYWRGCIDTEQEILSILKGEKHG